MCNLSQGVREKGMEKGQQNEFERSVRSMWKAGLDNTKIATLLEKDLTVVQAVKYPYDTKRPSGASSGPSSQSALAALTERPRRGAAVAECPVFAA